jgi:multiple sugar transport system substrate-binding protein
MRPFRLRKCFFPAFLLITGVVSLLAGCQLQEFILQTAGPTTTATVYSITDDVTTPAATILPTTAPSPARLILWLPPQFDPENGTPAAAILKQRLIDFETAHPQFTVEVRIKAMEGQSGLLESLKSTAVSAPAALPALVALPYPIMDEAVSASLLQPIRSDMVSLENTDWLPYARESAAVDGQTYGFPFAGDALVLAYRPLVSPEPPTTWQQLVGQQGFVVFPGADPEAAVVTDIYLSAGGSLTDDTGAPTLQAQPLEVTLKLLNDGAQGNALPYWIGNFSSFDQSWEIFTNQQAEYALTWSSLYLSSMPENASIAPVPGFDLGSTSLAKTWAWCIPAGSTTDRQNSLLLAQWLSDPDFVNRWSLAAGYLPVHESGLANWQDHPDIAFIIELVHSDRLIPLAAPNEVTTPLLQDAAIQIIKKQTYYEQILNSIIGQIQVK